MTDPAPEPFRPVLTFALALSVLGDPRVSLPTLGLATELDDANARIAELEAKQEREQ